MDTKLFALAVLFALFITIPLAATEIMSAGTLLPIVIPTNPTQLEEYAAEELANHITLAANCAPEIIKSDDYTAKAVRIKTIEGGKDTILLQSDGDSLLLAGALPAGPLYAVYEFLETYCGVRWWTSREMTVPVLDKISVPDDLDFHYTPLLYNREIFYQDVIDHPEFASRLRSNGHANKLPEKMGGHYEIIGFCHTFDQFVPRREYLLQHPEYFEEIDGKRPGVPQGSKSVGQLCPVNTDVQELMAQKVLAILRSTPDARVISVSQNDNRDYCRCSSCMASINKYGTPAAPLLELVNYTAGKVAEEFPDVKIETLAYQYTRKAPAGMKIADNVIIRLCSIECDFSKPLFAGSNASFRRDIEEWQTLAPELAIWNYVTNFSNYLIPHPNFNGQKDDTKFFADHKVTTLFQQGDYQSGGIAGDFTAMRAWILAKQAWDPDLQQEQLMDEFLAGYYGKTAAPLIKKYIMLFEDEITAYNEHFGCFRQDTLQWLSAETIARAFILRREIEAAAGQDNIPEIRLQAAFQPLESVFMERILGSGEHRKELCRAMGINEPSGEEFINLTENYIKLLENLGTDYFRENWYGKRRLADQSVRLREKAAELAKGN